LEHVCPAVYWGYFVLSTPDASALYPSADADGSDSDNIGAESDQATEDIPAVAITMALFCISVRRERLMSFTSISL
jgi:hypothetical protein